jgi:hypothetical protein
MIMLLEENQNNYNQKNQVFDTFDHFGMDLHSQDMD